jgi:hypothetical protein
LLEQIARANIQVSGLDYQKAAYADISAAAGVSGDPHIDIAAAVRMREQKGQPI